MLTLMLSRSIATCLRILFNSWFSRVHIFLRMYLHIFWDWLICQGECLYGLHLACSLGIWAKIPHHDILNGLFDLALLESLFQCVGGIWKLIMQMMMILVNFPGASPLIHIWVWFFKRGNISFCDRMSFKAKLFDYSSSVSWVF